MTGTYSGQFAMEGFLNLKWKRWQRVLITRTIAIVPTFLVAFYSQLDDLTKMNDYLNAVMVRLHSCLSLVSYHKINKLHPLSQALQLPFATIPTIAFTSSTRIMGDFANGFVNKVISIVLSVVVIGINIYFVTNTVMEAHLSSGWMTLIGNISLESLITSINIIIFCFDFFSLSQFSLR